jgi:hypothetical protein
MYGGFDFAKPKGLKMSTTAKKMKGKRSASALVLVVLAIVILALVGVGLIRIGLNSHLYAIRNSRFIAARSAADAGLAKAIYDLNQKRQAGPWTGSGLPSATDEILPKANSVFSYQITPLSGNPNYSYRIDSTGKAGFAQQTVHSTTTIRSLADYAIFVKNDLILKAGTTVSGFDSSDPSNDDVDVKIGTNSTEDDSMFLLNGVTVNGDVIVGAGGDPEEVIKGAGDVTGGEYATADEVFTIYSAPNGLGPKSLPTISGSNSPYKINDVNNTGTYSSVELKRGSGPGVLEVESGDVIMHITGDLNMGQDCEIIIKAGASLTIYIAGDVTSGNNSGFVNENTPPNFKLYGIATDSQDFDIKAKSEYFGQIYAPNADVTVYAKGDIRGAFVAESFEMKSSGNIYYDLALSFVDINDPTARFAINRWYE